MTCGPLFFARFTLTFAICAYLSDFPFPPSAFRLLFTNQCFGVIFHQLVMAEKKTTLTQFISRPALAG